MEPNPSLSRRLLLRLAGLGSVGAAALAASGGRGLAQPDHTGHGARGKAAAGSGSA